MAFECICRKILIFMCLLTVSIHAFELGTERTFSFVNDVNLYELKLSTSQAIGYRTSGEIKVSTIYEDNEHGFLLRFELLSPQLYMEKFKVQPMDYDEKSSILDKYKKSIFYAYWKAGIIEKSFIKNTKDSSLNNFLRSILSLFQYQLLDTKTTEKDISGTCQVKYVAKSSTKFLKIKSDCTAIEQHERLDQPLGNEVKLTRVTVIETSTLGEIETLHSSDHHQFYINAYKHVGYKVGSIFYLKSDGTIKDCEVIKADNLENAIKTLEGFIETSILPEINFDKSTDVTIVKQLKELKENLSNEKVGKETSALALLKLLQTGRQSKAEDLIRIVNARTTKEIKGQIMDLLAAIQTEESHEAFRSTMNFTNEEEFDNIERYLQSLSVGVLPRESVIKNIFEVLINDNIQNEKLKDTLVQTIASMCKKFTNLPNQSYDSEIVVKFKNFLLESIDSCTNNDCKEIYIRGLQNLQSPNIIDKLVMLALNEPYQISVAAMKALNQFPSTILQGDKKQFESIFYQQKKKFDTSARTIALDILLRLKPETKDIMNFVSYLKSNDPAYEVKQYLVQKLKMLAEKCERFKEILQMVLSSDRKVYNWNNFGALKGLSTALTRKFSQNPSFNGSLISVQEIKGGVLKRGNVDLLLEHEEEKFGIFTLGLFAGGLSSFVSSDEEEVDPDEDTTATAGMELAVQGNYLRPLVFFSGQAQLMGHVWSGTASEPTSAYQGITMLQDHKQVFALNNGAILDFSSLGAMSMDLNGKIEISLWYKNANIEVVQNMGLALLSTLSVKSPLISSKIELSITQEPQINLASKVDFSSKTAICMQLTQPNINLTQKINRYVDIPESKKVKALRQEVNLKYKIPGYTHVLNQKNNDMCNAITSE
ncbi:hypothetical protein PVAND_005168 [Polypedilum vanderplanki]|uniref:Vitellogenin domain-containing protein n=1 Tax=Polypedilum vanderplanki TaxID=319348 RepID=A0A9J6C090_POLVA|nr:hypothetical protein PVAND_005168 [Polypedilum vanderplanki]